MSIKNRLQNEQSQIDWNSMQLLLDEKKAAGLLGVSLSYLRKSRCEGTIRDCTAAPKFVNVGNRVYYRRNDLMAWVENLTSHEHI